MELDFYSFFCYVGSLLIMFFLTNKYETTELPLQRKVWLIFSFLFVVFFCALRFYVGNDYARYVIGFYGIKQFYGANVYFWEPAYFILNRIFLNCYAGYIYVFAFATLISFIFIFKTLNYYNILKWGIFFTFTLGLLIFLNNGIRQGVALSIFIYSIRFIENRKFIRYLLCILLAATFHFSAFILVFVYFVRYIRLSYYTWLFLLVSFFFLQYTGILRQVFIAIISHIPFYNAYIEKVDIYTVEATPGFGILYNFLMAVLLAFVYRKSVPNTILTIYFLGSVLYICSVGILLLERIAFYLMYTNVIVFAHFVTLRRYRQVAQVFIFLTFIYFSIQSLTGMEKHGAVPYRTIFNEDLENPPSEHYHNEI